MKKSKLHKQKETLDELEEELVEDDAASAIKSIAKTVSEEDEINDEDGAANESEVKTDEPSSAVDTDEVKRLKDDIEALRSELEAKKNECERIFRELAEFAVNFPRTSMGSITDEVWESVKGGVPLSAAYALYEKKKEADENAIRELNRINAERSSGAISSTADGGYYSPDEVRKMTAYEVKKNYNLIIESMKKWN